jgi:hypothetical protein
MEKGGFWVVLGGFGWFGVVLGGEYVLCNIKQLYKKKSFSTVMSPWSYRI